MRWAFSQKAAFRRRGHKHRHTNGRAAAFPQDTRTYTKTINCSIMQAKSCAKCSHSTRSISISIHIQTCTTEKGYNAHIEINTARIDVNVLLCVSVCLGANSGNISSALLFLCFDVLRFCIAFWWKARAHTANQDWTHKQRHHYQSLMRPVNRTAQS
jgi:hypothetical protein